MKSRWFACLAVVLLACLIFAPTSFAQQGTLEVYLSDPSEGETYYAGPTSLCYTVKIQGWVISSAYPFKEIEVGLELRQDGKVVGALATTPDIYGQFAFDATVNPQGPDGHFTPVEIEAHCEDCHFRSGLNFPVGHFSVRVIARSPDGATASAERQARTDLSQYTTIPVRVVLDDSQHTPVAGVPVKGSTWLYLWRARVKSGLTGADGLAALNVEALSLAPADYLITVEPAVIDGYYYEATAPVKIALGPGEMNQPPVTVEVTRKLGQIHGRLTSQGAPVPLDISLWLVHLPDASARQIAVNGGEFALADMPIEQYLVVADAGLFAGAGYQAASQPVDFDRSTAREVDLPLEDIRPGTVRVQIQDAQGQPLPFAWINLESEESYHQLAPGSPTLEVFDLPETSQTAILSAPGYYSQAAVLNPLVEKVENISLALDPDSQVMPWGAGAITLPAQSAFEVHGLDIRFERGWMWGDGGAALPLIIDLGSATVNIPQGKFAIESVPGKTPWFYLWEGSAQIKVKATGVTANVSPNQMAAILDQGTLAPVPFNPVVTAALHASAARPFEPVWQPDLRAQIRDRLALVGVGTAQLITFITYLLVFLSIILVPAYWLYSSYRKRNLAQSKSPATEEFS